MVEGVMIVTGLLLRCIVFALILIGSGVGLPAVVGASESGADQSYTDVPAGHAFFDEIEWLAAAGIAEGYADGTFDPTGAVSRQAVAAFLHRFAGAPDGETPTEPSFDDVPVDHPFFAEIEWLAAAGIAEGYPDGTFDPTAAVSRQAVAAFLYRFAAEPALTPPDEPSFSDVGAGHPFAGAIEVLAVAEVVGGYADQTFRPMEDVSRQAIAAFLHRYETPWQSYVSVWDLNAHTSISITEHGDAVDVMDGATVTVLVGRVELVADEYDLFAGIGCDVVGGTFTLTGAAVEAELMWGGLDIICSPAQLAQNDWLGGLLAAEDLELRRLGQLLIFSSGPTTLVLKDTGHPAPGL
jgi:hypothetical protein